MKFLILLVAIFIFSVLLIAVSHDPRAADPVAKQPERRPRPQSADDTEAEPAPQPVLAQPTVAQPTEPRPLADIAARREPAFFEYVGPRQSPRGPQAPTQRPAVSEQPWRSPYVIDLSDRD